MNSKMTFAATSLLLAGVLAVSYGCASSSDEGAGGNTGSSSSSESSSSGGGGAGSSGNSSGGSSGGDSSSSSSSGGGGSGNTVTFVAGKADGFFKGYGYVTLGAQDTITDPTCKTESDPKVPITKASACTTQTNWNNDSKLCISGKIPALDSAKPDYTGNWGVQIGVNAADPTDAVGAGMSSFKTVTFYFSGTPTSGLRGLFHRKGDDPDKTTPYCMDSIKSGKAYELLKFNRDCWGPTSSTEYLKEADLPQIDLLGLQVSSTTSGEIEVKDLCLEKVEFGTSI